MILRRVVTGPDNLNRISIERVGWRREYQKLPKRDKQRICWRCLNLDVRQTSVCRCAESFRQTEVCRTSKLRHRSYVTILVPMKTRQQRLRRDFTCLSILNGLTSTALGVCLLLGPGFQVSNLIGDFSSSKSATYFEQSYQPDSAVSRLERQVTASDKSPRRQTSFGALANAVELSLCLVTIERTLADFRRDSLTTASHQNDRAPPV